MKLKIRQLTMYLGIGRRTRILNDEFRISNEFWMIECLKIQKLS
jgi:hypothetical protein